MTHAWVAIRHKGPILDVLRPKPLSTMLFAYFRSIIFLIVPVFQNFEILIEFLHHGRHRAHTT